MVVGAGCTATTPETDAALCTSVSEHFLSCGLVADALSCAEDPTSAAAFLDHNCDELTSLATSSADLGGGLFSVDPGPLMSIDNPNDVTYEGALHCDIFEQGALAATGIALVTGVTASACAGAGGVAIAATAGAAAAVAVPLCAFATSTAAAWYLTALALHGATLICESGAIELLLEGLTDLGNGAAEYIYRGVTYILACSAATYLYYVGQKTLQCSYRPRSCRAEGLTCTDIRDRLRNGSRCITARRGMQTCWGANADGAHASEISKAIRSQEICIQKFAELECGRL
ncbi:MAG: hypothetical protein AAGF12_05090 [Myxococcota bacterium]